MLLHRRRITVSSRRAFSLVELLVVVGVIGLLVALLMPALAKAWRQAYQVACTSNLRQLASAMLAYASANRGSYPDAAIASRETAEDWVHWQDPNNPTSTITRNLRNSTILPYLGGFDVLKCPMGVPERPPHKIDGGRSYPPYPFSYSLNSRFPGVRGFFNAAKLNQIRSASLKVMAIEEDQSKINDGGWWPLDSEYPSLGTSSVSVIHDRGREFGNYETDRGFYWQRGRGNVVFADGHCEFLHRRYLAGQAFTDPRYSGP
jgi:prepilin-type N-terminal cleavage/methylation domain-containing protein/prepilin-type processing-associated H-X9-DG protein